MTDSNSYDAVIVGAGPNGLAAAITLIRQGLSVVVCEAKETTGGGTRTAQLTLPGFHHDICSAVHPLALVSPFFRSVDLSEYGLAWIHSPASLAHPLDDGTAVVLERSAELSAQRLNSDAERYYAVIQPLIRNWEALAEDILQPLSIPDHPLILLQFAMLGLRSAEKFSLKRFRGEKTRALFAGLAAHSILPLNSMATTSFGLLLATAAHTVGWPIAGGGSQSIADALERHFMSLGGVVKTNHCVNSIHDLPEARAVLFDLIPRQIADIVGDRFPQNYTSRLRNHRHGPGVFKMDWALDGAIPWKAADCLSAATVHLGGSLEEIAASEMAAWQGQHVERPFVILAQPSLFDNTRAPEGKHTVWAYCHVPNGSTFDMTDRVESQIERFAPGFRERILARSVMLPIDMQTYNPNYQGGDIAGGAQFFTQLFFKPLGRWHAYSTPVKGIYICSSSMPPGAGVHGMCGYNAANVALNELY